MVPADRLTTIDQAAHGLMESGIAEKTLQPGDRAPEFELADGDGMRWRSTNILRSGPLVVIFYRGRWCAYCNAQLVALQQIHSQVASAGASMVAISPQTEKHSYMTRDMHALRFPVLSDPGNDVARKFGLVYRVAPDLQQMYESIMTRLPGYNGDSSWELPMPATYLIRPDGIISYVRVDADWRDRPEPEEVIEELNHKGHEERQGD